MRPRIEHASIRKRIVAVGEIGSKYTVMLATSSLQHEIDTNTIISPCVSVDVPFSTCDTFSSTLDRSQTQGHRLGTVTPSPLHALDFYRALVSAITPLFARRFSSIHFVYSHKHGAFRAQ